MSLSGNNPLGPSAPTTTVAKPRILVAEDNAVERAVLVKTVAKFGYEVIVAVDGLEAWNHLQQPDAPQIALLDWMMPGLNGPEICQRVRLSQKDQTLYILLVTGKNSQADLVAGLESGADDFISKPWNPAELRARIEVGCRMVNLQNRLRENVAELEDSLARTQRLIAEQNLNIDLARKLLRLANDGTGRWIDLSDDLTLHLASFSVSCARAGGDHYWAHTQPARDSRGAITTISLRDQSGHEVNCVLRSIASDLIHMRALKEPGQLEEQIARVNNRLCDSGMFADDDFVTALTLELEHDTLRLRFVSCGHPPMILIRGASAQLVPEDNGRGRNFPLGTLRDLTFDGSDYQLQAGDRILLYTDGLSDLGKKSRNRSFSHQEILEFVTAILRESPNVPVSALIQRLLASVSPNQNIVLNPSDLPDDITVLGLELESDASGEEAVLHFRNFAEIDAATRLLHDRIASAWRFDTPGMGLRQLLDEALTNAWLHGNKKDPSLPIRVNWHRQNGCSLQIENAGPGFDPELVADPLSSTGVLRESGRGLFIIRSLCDWVRWKKNGRRLVARLTEHT